MKKSHLRKLIREELNRKKLSRQPTGDESVIELNYNITGDPVQYDGYDWDVEALVDGEGGIIELKIINPETDEVTTYRDDKPIVGDKKLISTAIEAVEKKFEKLSAASKDEYDVDRGLEREKDRAEYQQNYYDDIGNGMNESTLKKLIKLVTEVISESKTKNDKRKS